MLLQKSDSLFFISYGNYDESFTPAPEEEFTASENLLYNLDNSKSYDVATFIDNAAPIQVVIDSTGGNVFKNGEESTVLTAVVYQYGDDSAKLKSKKK